MSLVRKPVRERSRSHRAFIGKLQCLASAAEGVTAYGCDCAHVSFLQPHGLGHKSGDQFTVPLVRAMHQDQHDNPPESVWWARRGFTAGMLRVLCNDLWDCSGDVERGEHLIAMAAAAAHRTPKLLKGGDLAGPVLVARPVLVAAHLTDTTDADGNVEVLFARLGRIPPTRVAVDPDTLRTDKTDAG